MLHIGVSFSGGVFACVTCQLSQSLIGCVNCFVYRHDKNHCPATKSLCLCLLQPLLTEIWSEFTSTWNLKTARFASRVPVEVFFTAQSSLLVLSLAFPMCTYSLLQVGSGCWGGTPRRRTTTPFKPLDLKKSIKTHSQWLDYSWTVFNVDAWLCCKMLHNPQLKRFYNPNGGVSSSVYINYTQAHFFILQYSPFRARFWS